MTFIEVEGSLGVFFQPPKKHLPLINREVGPPKRTKSEEWRKAESAAVK